MELSKEFMEGYKVGRQYAINNLSTKIYNLGVTKRTLEEISYYSESSMEAVNWYLETFNALLIQLKNDYKKEFKEGE